jgi:exodeoxyribonuclease V gamma subunit
MRELEVLHDRLLDLFERIPGLTPKDILVMLPNVETHAPFIDAVFGSPESDATRIPFTIADRSAQARSIVARTLLRLLDLHGSRFGAGAVVEILEARPVRERFGIAETDLDTIRGWIERTNIRWGIDAPHRTTFDLPGFEQNSWRAGLDRCLLGYALRGDGEDLFEGLLPDTQIEGNLAELLGRFADVTENLFQLIPRLGIPRTLAEWSETLRRLFETFFSDAGEDSGEIFRARRVVGGLAELAEYYSGKVTFAAMRAHLEAVLSDSETSSGFLAGHVTFCSLKPMRSIPFRVICLLGMNDTAFPRRETPLAFDLLAEKARASGRSRRDEDRQLFLEAILSARDVLYLSYAGLSAKENTESPPAVVVTELLDYVETAYGPEFEKGELRQAVVHRHPLQPFSPRYFTGAGPLFSYSLENSRASSAGSLPRLAAVSRIDGLLPEPEAEWRSVDLRSLAEFFCHPARYYLEKRLRVRLPEREEALDESEPMTLDHLARWQLSQSFAQALLAGGDAARRIQTARAAGLLPAGHFGEVEVARVVADMTELVDRVRAAPLGDALPPWPLSLQLGPWHLHGTLDHLHRGGMLRTTGWEISPKDRLRAWVNHLFLNAGVSSKGGSSEVGCVTYLFGTDGCWRGEPIPDAMPLLADLLELYGQGLRTPLPFFPKSSYDYARRKLKPKQNEFKDPADAARERYEAAEMSDSHNDLCFRHSSAPYGPAWEELAGAVFAPMFERSKEEAS